jgi:hypothetical protein
MAKMEYTVEWVDTVAVLRAARTAIHKAGISDVEAELAQGVHDWADPECHIRTRRFPSLPIAKAWATKNRELDWFHEPRVFVTRTAPVAPWPLEKTETLEEWRFDGEDALSLYSA